MTRRILVVDDEPDIRQLITIMLENAGYEVIPADTGLKALEYLQADTCDLVILDIMMPEMDGWEICRRLKSQSRTKQIPVIILTVRSQPLDRVIGLEVVRADDYLSKPFERTELLATVERLLALPTPARAADA